MVFFADRLPGDDPDRNADATRRAFAEGDDSSATSLRRLADGLYLSDRGFGTSGDFFDQSRALYLTVAEIFAPAGECFLFWLAFRGKGQLESSDWTRCMIAIVIANLASFGFGEIMNAYGWFGLF